MKKEKWWEGWSPDDLTPDLFILTKHPPKGHHSSEELSKLPPAHFKPQTEEDLQYLIPLGIAFKKTQNPLYAIEAFIISHKAGVYPPLWVLDYMAQVFDDWRKLEGRKSLDELFEIKPIRGQTPICKADREERRDEMLCQHVFVLTKDFDFTVEEACHIVARRLEETPGWDKTGLKAISGDTIMDRYYRKWHKIFTSLIGEAKILEEQRIDFLRQFPEDSFPPNKSLKEMIQRERRS